GRWSPAAAAADGVAAVEEAAASRAAAEAVPGEAGLAGKSSTAHGMRRARECAELYSVVAFRPQHGVHGCVTLMAVGRGECRPLRPCDRTRGRARWFWNGHKMHDVSGGPAGALKIRGAD